MSYIIDGVYHKGKPPIVLAGINKQYRTWNHDMQRAEHKRDLIQPYDKNGNLSEEFIREYPEESKIYKEGNNGKSEK